MTLPAVALNVLAAIDVTVANTSPTLTANQTGATYQWLDCNNSNAIIPSETSQAFTATVNGDYAVEITVGNCVDTSACENVNTIGINELTTGSVSIYPNPTTSLVTVDLSSYNGVVKYQVLTIEGRVVLNESNINSSTFTFDLSTESKGIYLLNISTENETKVYKVVKE